MPIRRYVMTSGVLCSSRRTRAPFFFFFFNDTATTEIYTLSLHDALPISRWKHEDYAGLLGRDPGLLAARSEEHTSELQSPCNLVCRLLLEKKKTAVGDINGDPQKGLMVLIGTLVGFFLECKRIHRATA